MVASLLVGTASLRDLRKLGRIGGKTLGYYMFTTAIAVTLGLVLANVTKPGSRVVAPETSAELTARYGGDAASRMNVAENAPTWQETLLRVIPRNPVQAAAEMDLLPLIFFTICFGAALTVIQTSRRRRPRWWERRPASGGGAREPGRFPLTRWVGLRRSRSSL